jgi:hypothetical protein
VHIARCRVLISGTAALSQKMVQRHFTGTADLPVILNRALSAETAFRLR